jgi:hypothetical protein
MGTPCFGWHSEMYVNGIPIESLIFYNETWSSSARFSGVRCETFTCILYFLSGCESRENTHKAVWLRLPLGMSADIHRTGMSVPGGSPFRFYINNKFVFTRYSKYQHLKVGVEWSSNYIFLLYSITTTKNNNDIIQLILGSFGMDRRINISLA